MNPLMNLVMCMADYYVTPGTPSTSGADAITNMMDTLGNQLEVWSKTLTAILGIIMLVIAITKIAGGLMSKNGNVNWTLCIALLLLGGMFAYAGGWGIVQNIGKGAGVTLNDIGTGHVRSVDDPNAIILITPRPSPST